MAKKSKKPIYLLLILLLVFGSFIFLLMKPSLQTKTIEQIQVSNNIDEIKSIYDKYKFDLLENDERGQKVVAPEFQQAIRDKLNTLNLSENDIKDILIWLPPARENLNIIIVPDLSRRIADTINNPEQIRNDIALLNKVWENFVSKTKFKMNTKDRLIVDVTDDNQADGQFRKLADSLFFDLSTHTNKSNRLFYESVEDKFQEKITELYNLASSKPLGADYHSYFSNRLKRFIKKPTLDDTYRNVLIILTNGYLEAENNQRTGIWAYTGTYPERLKVSNAIKRGVPYQQALNDLKPIPDCPIHFPDLEVLVLEVNPRTKRTNLDQWNDPGTVNDFPILKHQWKEWFDLLEIKNAKNDNIFNKRHDATKLTEEILDDFFK